MTPLAPNVYSCTRLGFRVYVDGPSVQATVAQDELRLDHFSFCSRPAGAGPPWVISADTGIHPSADGERPADAVASEPAGGSRLAFSARRRLSPPG
jgi:hypothetical protein